MIGELHSPGGKMVWFNGPVALCGDHYPGMVLIIKAFYVDAILGKARGPLQRSARNLRKAKPKDIATKLFEGDAADCEKRQDEFRCKGRIRHSRWRCRSLGNTRQGTLCLSGRGRLA